MADFIGMKINYAFRPDATKKVVDYSLKQINKLWENAAQNFLLSIVQDTLQYHIDSGMSLASTLPLASKLKIQKYIQAILAGRGKVRPGHKKLFGKWASNNAKYRSQALGERLGKKAYTLKYSESNDTELKFMFDIVVFQYFLHENGYAFGNEGNAWKSLDRAREEFVEVWNKKIKFYLSGSAIINILFQASKVR